MLRVAKMMPFEVGEEVVAQISVAHVRDSCNCIYTLYYLFGRAACTNLKYADIFLHIDIIYLIKCMLSTPLLLSIFYLSTGLCTQSIFGINIIFIIKANK